MAIRFIGGQISHSRVGLSIPKDSKLDYQFRGVKMKKLGTAIRERDAGEHWNAGLKHESSSPARKTKALSEFVERYEREKAAPQSLKLDILKKVTAIAARIVAIGSAIWRFFHSAN